ncbi:MAG TPA: cupin domain-containing protein, partial [Lachnospira eligens]|nr:cupin domain-containing protein [Lachnospira eligens]
MKKPYITLEEALAAREEGRRSVKFLTEANGCINGCCSGVTICSETEFNPEPGFHDDQEGFFVLEGDGIVRLDNEEFEVKAGDSFIALPGVR